jgi:drug/metabolite transporter (DMT)-like permease
MSGTALTIVAAAALLHALWNAMVKASGDRAVTLGMIALGHLILGGIAAIFLPLPGWQAAPWILASTVIHWGYYWLIFHAYRLGDLSLVYPISRGAAPVLVTLGAMVAVGERLTPMGWAGVLAVSGGVMLLAWGELRRGVSGAAAGLALLLGLVIAAYSVADGTGARVSDSVAGYIAWLFVCEGIAAAWLLAIRMRSLARLGPRPWLLGIAGGLASAVAYGLAIWAKTLAPFGLVSALRETSVVIAAGIGVMWFGERPWRPRLLAALVVATGAAAIALA